MKMKTLKYLLPVIGAVLWTEPCYSLGFPSFDMAEVAGTIKGVITSNMSLLSTGTSTAATAQMLLEKGEGVSSLLKFKDETVEKVKKEAKIAKRDKAASQKAAQRAKQLKKMGEDVSGKVKESADTIKKGVNDVQNIAQKEKVTSSTSSTNSTTDDNSLQNVNVQEEVNVEKVESEKTATMPVNTNERVNSERTFKSMVQPTFDKEANMSIVSRTSYAQSGLTDDGTFVYSDIIAEKCGLDFKDAENEDKVKDCIKTWVLCMHQEDAELALECKDLYQKAMHDQVSADLASSINDKKYATTFEDEVAGDLENKSSAATTEREEGSVSAAISRANQEVLLRMMNAMSSNLIQSSLLAVEQIDASYYEEE
ncbi:MAG: hypothetical protein E7016_03465 [Alphaproteobacteria bacterium]|nr:hypothetical protein [Alphaproteobacteria bacterium]